MPCARCDSLPSIPQQAGTLCLWFPLGHTAGKARARLESAGRTHSTREGCVQVPVADGPGACAAELLAALGDEEARATRALFLEAGREPSFADFARVVSLRDLAGIASASWLVEMLREERLVSWFHPIVSARDTSVIFGHEALLRGRDERGALVPPLRIFDAAREAGLLFQVDLAARRAAINGAARYPGEGCVFINFTPAAIYDPVSCLRSTVAAADAAGIRHDRLVFEVIEADRIADADHLQRVLDYYRSAGFRVALDDLGAGWSTLNLVHRLRPDFIKLDRELVSGVHQDPVKAVIAGKLLEIGQGLGIRTIVEGVEHEEELRWARASGADFVQGFLIARPEEIPAARTPRLAA